MFDPKAIRIIISLAFSKLGDLLVSAKTTLPAALIAAGAPVWIISVLVPIRESGALLPQAAADSRIHKTAISAVLIMCPFFGFRPVSLKHEM